MQTYIIVADAARARIFRHAGSDGLSEVQDLVHPESQLHTGDLRTGGKGEVHDGAGSAAHQSDNRTTTMEKHADRFAKELAQYLRKVRTSGEANRFVVAAAPQFLGHLRAKLDSDTAALIVSTVDKDLSKESKRALRERFAHV